MQRRLEEARDVLFDELKHGRIDPLNVAQEDGAVAIIYRYMLAVRDCSARRNLRLLARVIAGLGQRDRLFADDFNKYAEALSRLTRDELLVLGTLYRHKREQRGRTPYIIDYWNVALLHSFQHNFRRKSMYWPYVVLRRDQVSSSTEPILIAVTIMARPHLWTRFVN
jgi:hypothetical protein